MRNLQLVLSRLQQAACLFPGSIAPRLQASPATGALRKAAPLLTSAATRGAGPTLTSNTTPALPRGSGGSFAAWGAAWRSASPQQLSSAARAGPSAGPAGLPALPPRAAWSRAPAATAASLTTITAGGSLVARGIYTGLVGRTSRMMSSSSCSNSILTAATGRVAGLTTAASRVDTPDDVDGLCVYFKILYVSVTFFWLFDFALRCTTKYDQVPYTGRWHVLNATAPDSIFEPSESKATYNLAWRTAFYKEMLLRRDHPDTQLVRRVGAALLKAADKAEADRKIHFRPTWCRPKEWEFEVVDDSGSSKAPAPCVACGGKVLVYTSLLDSLDRDEDLVAAVLAHEVARVLAQHEGELRTYTEGFHYLAYFLASLALPAFPVALLVALLAPVVLVKPIWVTGLGPLSSLTWYTDYEADAISMHLMAKAGFDPAAVPSLLGLWAEEHQKQQQQEAGSSTWGRLKSLVATRPPPLSSRAERAAKELTGVVAPKTSNCPA